MRTDRRIRLLEDKLKKPVTLARIVSDLKRKGKRIVFTNGCFDIMHYGHAHYLQEAKKMGDILVVAVNSDASIKLIKGPRRPLIKLADRLRLIASLESVDYVTSFRAPTPLALIKLLGPDILVKGGDWDKNTIIGSAEVAARGGKVYTIPLVQGRSTTALIARLTDAS